MRLLLIEDDDDLAQLLVRYLGRSGFTVTRVADGEAGIETFLTSARTETPFDIVVTDGLLPRKNGLQVGQAIRNSPGGNRVGLALISAAFRNERARADAVEGGFDAYFAKPFVLGDLRDGLLKLARRSTPPTPPPPAPPPGSSPSFVAGPSSSSFRAPPPTSSTAPSSSSSSSSSGAPAPPAATPPTVPRVFIEPRRKSHVILDSSLAVAGLPSTGRFLLLASRARLDGVIEFSATDGGRVRVAFLAGVIVGAWDDLPEHQLGPWLVAQGRLTAAQGAALDARLASTKERVAEALLALGYVTAAEALALVEAQVKSRVRRALHLHGIATVEHGIDNARALAAGVIEAVEEVLRAGLDPAARVAAETFIFARADEQIVRTIDFDAGLVALARQRPTSTLPQKLLERSHVFGDFSGDDAHHLYAMWLAGLVRSASEGPGPDVAVPRASSSGSREGFVDKALVEQIAALLLRARGASVYRLLGVAPTTPTDEVRRGLHELMRRYGRQPLRDVALGPARGAAGELQAILEEGLFAFSDERRRQAYDDDLAGR